MSISGQIVISTPGLAVQGPSGMNGEKFLLKGHPNNTGLVLLSDDANSGSTGGFPLAAGDVVLRRCRDLSGIYFNTDMANSKLTWWMVE